jgi:hypothetical protein
MRRKYEKFSLKTDRNEDTDEVNIDGSIMWRLVLKKRDTMKFTESRISE